MHQVEIATTQESLLDNPQMVLNMGPQHPSTHGVLRVILKLDGESMTKIMQPRSMAVVLAAQP